MPAKYAYAKQHPFFTDAWLSKTDTAHQFPAQFEQANK